MHVSPPYSWSVFGCLQMFSGGRAVGTEQARSAPAPCAAVGGSTARCIPVLGGQDLCLTEQHIFPLCSLPPPELCLQPSVSPGLMRMLSQPSCSRVTGLLRAPPAAGMQGRSLSLAHSEPGDVEFAPPGWWPLGAGGSTPCFPWRGWGPCSVPRESFSSLGKQLSTLMLRSQTTSDLFGGMPGLPLSLLGGPFP